MSLLPKDEAELLRLKMQMEVIRTICPMMMILIQLFIIIHIYQQIASTLSRGRGILFWRQKSCQLFYLQMRTIRIQDVPRGTLPRKKCKKSLTFRKFWRAGASAKVKYFFERSSKTFFSNWTKLCSLFWRAGASSRVTKLRLVCSAPIIQCGTWRVKSYLHEW